MLYRVSAAADSDDALNERLGRFGAQDRPT